MKSKVFKFGGASTKNAEGVRNLSEIVKKYSNHNLIIVVSAMGKNTNALEEVWKMFLVKDRQKAKELFTEIVNDHYSLVLELFGEQIPKELDLQLKRFADYVFEVLEMGLVQKPGYYYDQIVSVGELFSSAIVSAYLHKVDVSNQFLDVRKLIKTDFSFQEAKVDWPRTVEQVKREIEPLMINKSNSVFVTQGFIAGADQLSTTTLGREGSDYSAAILAYALDAECVSVWKDVAGLLNADPRYFPDAKKIEHISYKEAIELAYYGASVIHPKTVQPLQNKSIPLYVKSFLSPESSGTLIDSNTQDDGKTASYIVRFNQRLISLASKDFSFVVEENLSDIFKHFADAGIRINIMQNSAINFSVSVDEVSVDLEALILQLQEKYQVKYNSNLSLLTIRHYTNALIDELTQNKEIILEQRTRNTVRFLLRD